MPFALVIDLDLPRWQTAVIPVIGLLAAGFTFFAGRWALRRRRNRPPVPPPPAEPASPDYDPFDQGSLTERRRALRRKGNSVEVLVGEGESPAEPVRGWVIDRSTGGLCLLLSEEVASGTVLSVRPRTAPPETPWVRVEVRRCKKVRSGYEVGCRYERTPPWAVLLLFG